MTFHLLVDMICEKLAILRKFILLGHGWTPPAGAYETYNAFVFNINFYKQAEILEVKIYR